MSVTQIPSGGPLPPATPPPESRDLFEAQHWENAYRGFNPDAVPHLLIQLQDDLSRARRREALWLSVILHLMIVILLWNSNKLMMLLPHRTVVLAIPANLEQDKNATFLELPPDEQKLTRRPDAKFLSDKDRIATSKAPQINREELRKILQSAHPGRPGEPMQQQQPQASAPASQMAQQAPPPQANPQQNNSSGFVAPAQNPQIAQMRVPVQGRPAPNFSNSITAGSAIEQAARAAAADRGRYGGGEGGDFGLSQGRDGAKTLGQAEILTDTMGVDFGPYLTRITEIVRKNWYNSMPPSVYPPILKQGKLSLEFFILRDGQVAGMQVHTPSGDIALDRAAWASITSSNPFPPLPREFRGQNLGLRFYYFYNMDVTDLK
jgi:TonB family protein